MLITPSPAVTPQGVAGEVVKAVQEGHLKHIFLVGGCDGHGEHTAFVTSSAFVCVQGLAALLSARACPAAAACSHRLPTAALSPSQTKPSLPSPHPSLSTTEPDRKYFTNVADGTPDDTLLLTLGCGKFRFYDHDYGMLPGTSLPRMVRRTLLALLVAG